jgi:phytoene synthase
MEAARVAPQPKDLASGYRAARDICRRHARSFHFASHFLPSDRRRHAYAVYAFCRGIDDAVDDGDPATVGQRLAAFRRILDASYDGGLPPDASEQGRALLAFSETVRACAIPREHFLDLARGCEMDLTISRYATWPDLENYCYHVAGVVGLIMCRVFGVHDAAALRCAVTFGNAMQLTNILRDVKEDWDRGRIYLPTEDLARFGVTEQQIASGLMTPGLRHLMTFEVARARTMFLSGAEGLVHVPAGGTRLTACAMGVIYAGILTALEREQLNPFAGRARLSLPQKLARLPAAWRLARRNSASPVPDVF